MSCFNYIRNQVIGGSVVFTYGGYETPPRATPGTGIPPSPTHNLTHDPGANPQRVTGLEPTKQRELRLARIELGTLKCELRTTVRLPQYVKVYNKFRNFPCLRMIKICKMPGRSHARYKLDGPASRSMFKAYPHAIVQHNIAQRRPHRSRSVLTVIYSQAGCVEKHDPAVIFLQGSA